MRDDHLIFQIHFCCINAIVVLRIINHSIHIIFFKQNDVPVGISSSSSALAWKITLGAEERVGRSGALLEADAKEARAGELHIKWAWIFPINRKDSKFS